MVRRLLLAAALCSPVALLACANSSNGDDDAGASSPGTGRGNGSSDASSPGADASTHPGDASAASDASAPGQDASSSDGSTSTDASSDAAADAPASQVPLPFFVSDQFVPSGFMGDSQASMMAITMAHDAATCKSPRQPGAGGDCYSVTWAPSPPDGGSAWAGVYWQSPSDNWGTKPGKAIAAGATKVSFYAAGAVGGETIQLCAGGIGGANTAYKDSFASKSQPITLTTTWTRYEVSLQGASYSTVLGGFCWTSAATAPMSAQFFIDDLKWE